MPTLDPLGERFDMQLLGKLTLSVAAVLFVSWVFRFYSSRARNRKRGSKSISPLGGTRRRSETCDDSETEFPQEEAGADEGTNGENQAARGSVDFTQERLNLEETNGVPQREPSNPKNSVTRTVETISPAGQLNTEYSTLVKATGEMNDCKPELAVLAPDLGFKATGVVGGRRSPCLLRKIDGGVEVGRELRQNVGHSGTFSSFQSKAEIKMENADLLMDGPGDQTTGVRGKIYDYYVETSSQSVSDWSAARSLSATLGPLETSTLFDSHSPSLPGVLETSQTAGPWPSSLMIRDLEFAQKTVRDPQAHGKSERIKRRHGLLRKDSYLAAAEDSELEIPFPFPVTGASRSKSALPSNAVHSGSESHKQKDLGWDPSEEPKVEVVAKAKFLCFHADDPKGSDLENLTSKLDLGNCLESLMLAKKHGHGVLQQAALRVMSDNYFQVLQDPSLYGRLKAGERDQIQRLRSKGSRCLMVADVESPEWARYPSHSLGSMDVSTSSGLYYYDDYKDSWHLRCQIPQEVVSKGCAMCTMDNYLFVALGFQKSVPSRKVFCYNPMTSIWSEICSMNEARPRCKLVALQDHVYAIGGECLSTVERYDPRTDRWIYVAPLPNETFAVAHRATACNGEIFVSGGTLKYTLLRYSPKTNAWRQSLIVGNKERTTEMVSVRNFLYRFDVNPSTGISVYRYHAVARLWYECCSKQMSRCPDFQCVAMDDVIYCVCHEFTMRFLADEVSPGFVAEDLKVPSASKGMLFPFVLSLPDKSVLQTTV